MSFSRDEIRAAAETHRELGPDYEAAVIDSFLDKVGKEIDARVDSRLAAPRQAYQARQARPPRAYSPLALAIPSIAMGIPLTAIALAVGSPSAGFAELLVIWIAITAINLAYAFHLRPPSG